jgi:Fe-S cluster biogenesis protein NfuA
MEKLKIINDFISDNINPVLSLHNGYCKAISLDGNSLTIEFRGGCTGCPSSKLTAFNYIAPELKQAFPELEEIEFT